MNERNDANESLHHSLFFSLNYHLADKGLTETERDRKDEFNEEQEQDKGEITRSCRVDMPATVRSHGFLSYINRLTGRHHCVAAPQTTQTVRSQLCCDIIMFFMMSACHVHTDSYVHCLVWLILS